MNIKMPSQVSLVIYLALYISTVAKDVNINLCPWKYEQVITKQLVQDA